MAWWTHNRLLLELCLNCDFFGLFDLGILGFQRHMIDLPFFSEFTQPFPVEWLSDLSFIVSFKFGDTFIFGHQFLKMAAALSRCSGLKVLCDQFKYFTDSKNLQKNTFSCAWRQIQPDNGSQRAYIWNSIIRSISRQNHPFVLHLLMILIPLGRSRPLL